MPHLHDKIDFTVETFIVYNDRVLLRMHDKYKKCIKAWAVSEVGETQIALHFAGFYC